ncbi:hypothetical protein F5X68DRAFT_275415, partial [Plectosphaerella plurivora]
MADSWIAVENEQNGGSRPASIVTDSDGWVKVDAEYSTSGSNLERATEPAAKLIEADNTKKTPDIVVPTMLWKRKEQKYPKILTTCCHWHTLLVSMQGDEDAGDLTNNNTILHFWPPSNAYSPAATHVSTKLTFDQVRRLQFFSELGPVVLPIAESSTPGEIHDYLTSLATTPDEDGSSDDAPDEEVVERIGQRLSGLPEQYDCGGLPINFATISIRSDAPDALHASGVAPAWNWAKSLSHYHPTYSSTPNFAPYSGNWYDDVAKAVNEGDWNAATDFMLLSTGFEEHHRDGLKT